MAGLCRERPVVSREKATRYCGKVVESGGRQIPTADWETQGKRTKSADRQGNREYASCVLRGVVVRLGLLAHEPQTERKCQRQQDSIWAAADCRRCRTSVGLEKEYCNSGYWWW